MTQLDYGAGIGSPEEAAAELRARAATLGVDLLPVSAEDLAAAAYGAHLWCRALGTCTLEFPAAHGVSAVECLAAIIARAAGHGKEPRHSGDADFAGHEWDELTESFTESERHQVASKVVTDLGMCGDDRLEAAAGYAATQS